ncbi:MAG: hypothetical protein RBT63_09540, partial [Bdellovibrionales bacterium]|nr:hypothetical protein [Bdellovibrionales bacterium]
MKCYNQVSLYRAFVLALMLSSTLVACVKPSPRSSEANANFADPLSGEAAQPASTFYNEEVTGSAIVSQNLPNFSIPTEKLFHFKTCVKDKRTRETIKGHKFVVKGGDKEIAVRSDEAGCLNWSEPFGFDGLNDAKFLPVKRTVVADGMHTGSRHLSICINPWNYDNSEAVRDCLRKPVPDEQLLKADEALSHVKGKNSDGSAVEQFLLVDDLRINTVHSPGLPEGAMLDFTVTMGPKIERRNVRGETDPYILKDGRFRTQIWLISKPSGDEGTCYIMARSDSKDAVAMDGGRLRDELRMSLSYIPTYGQLEMVSVVRAEGQDGKEVPGLRPFEGAWILGDYASLMGMRFGFDRTARYKKDDKAFSAEEYVRGCDDVKNADPRNQKNSPLVESARKIIDQVLTPDPVDAAWIAKVTNDVPKDLMTTRYVKGQDIPKLFPKDPIARKFKDGADTLFSPDDGLPSGIRRLDQFSFGLISVRAEPILRESTTERTIKYVVTTRVTNPLSNWSPARKVEFMVENSKGEVVRKVTNDEGDLIFDDVLHHTYYQPEGYILNVVRITHPSGFSRRLGIVLNPWANNDGFVFGRDIRRMTVDLIAQVNLIERPKSELIVMDFNWGAQGFRYEVDDLLGLTIYKQFLLKLRPRALRYSSLMRGILENESLRDGVYLMKLAVHRDYRPPGGEAQEVITAIRKLVRVASGEINTPVEVAFRDFRILKFRANFMVELETIEESKLTAEEKRTLYTDKPLESLLAKDSGLAARSFIGPVVAYSNGFTATMRPTDDLAESYCKHETEKMFFIDCDELKRHQVGSPSYEAEEEAKFVGSIRHMAHVSVTQIIERQDALDKEYRRNMVNRAQLPVLLKDGNFEYAVRWNEDVVLKRNSGVGKDNVSLPVGSTFKTLVSRLSDIRPNRSFSSGTMGFSSAYTSFTGNKPVDTNAMDQVFFGGSPLTQDLAARLCVFFVEDLILRSNSKAEDSLSFAEKAAARYRRQQLNDNCLRSALGDFGARAKSAGEPTFIVEHKYRVARIAETARGGGNLLYVNTGTNSSFDRSRSMSFSYGFSPLGPVNGLLKAVPAMVGVQRFLDASGFSVGWSNNQSTSMSDGASVGSQVSLSV